MANQHTNNPPLEQRFWARVDKSGQNGHWHNIPCWIWNGNVANNGYGRFYVSRGKMVSAHRFSYSATHGTIPDGLDVLHYCDNPICVQPAHLFLGTQFDNHADMISKDRWNSDYLRGEKNGRAKLTNAQVAEIRHLHSQGQLSQTEIAKRFGVSLSTISLINLKKKWQSV